MVANIMNFGGQSSPPTSSHVSWTPSSDRHMQSENVKKRKAGRKKFQETRHPVYKGVRQRNGKWVSELRQPNKKSRVWVGTFACPDMAARAYDVAALALKGESAELNFPEDANALPRIEAASSTREIQCAAGAFADTRKAYVDEEELFNMPALLNSMAEGLILTPPALQKGFSWDDFEEPLDFSLWTE